MPQEIEVKFTVQVPDEATDQQIQDWLDNRLGCDAKIGLSPLAGVDIEADDFSVTFK